MSNQPLSKVTLTDPFSPITEIHILQDRATNRFQQRAVQIPPDQTQKHTTRKIGPLSTRSRVLNERFRNQATGSWRLHTTDLHSDDLLLNRAEQLQPETSVAPKLRVVTL